jgi:hypothetical protein
MGMGDIELGNGSYWFQIGSPIEVYDSVFLKEFPSILCIIFWGTQSLGLYQTLILFFKTFLSVPTIFGIFRLQIT